MTSEFERAAAFEEALREACIEKRERSRFGVALLNASLPHVWSVNLLRVEASDADAEELIADAEQTLGKAELNHRRLLVTDEELGRRLERPLVDRGWKTDHFVYMVSHREPSRRDAAHDVVEVDRESVLPLRHAILTEWLPDLDSETVGQIMASDRCFAEAGNARYFAVLVDGAVVSAANLYSDGRTAQIEDVATSPEHRGRGHATAVTLRALDEARTGGHDFVFLVADARDWPKELYRRLGFDEVGERYVYRLRLTESSAEPRRSTGAE